MLLIPCHKYGVVGERRGCNQPIKTTGFDVTADVGHMRDDTFVRTKTVVIDRSSSSSAAHCGSTGVDARIAMTSRPLTDGRPVGTRRAIGLRYRVIVSTCPRSTASSAGDGFCLNSAMLIAVMSTV